MQSGNPVLSAKAWARVGVTERVHAMTVQGCMTKTALLLGCLLVTTGLTWRMALARPEAVLPWLFGGLVGGFVLAMVTIFKKTWAPVTAPLYALAEGLFIGAISCLLNQRFPGIAVQAAGLTFGVLLAMLLAYKMRLIRVTARFRAGVVAATGGIFLVYLMAWILRIFGATVPFIHGSGLIGIGFSLFVVVIAALNLVLDFDFIETAAAQGAPKYMEWYGAFGLMVTLVWLYIEILRLLSKLNRR